MSETCPQCGGLTGHNAQKAANTLQMTGQRAFACQGHPEPDRRDTQFAGYATLLMEELKPDLTMLFTELSSNYPSRKETGVIEAESIIKQRIARRAHDLVSHTLYNTGPMMIDCMSHEEQIAEIPDRTTWPEETK